MPFKKGDANYSRTNGPWNKETRDWKKEICEVAARLQMCVILPKKYLANARIRCSCSHGVVKETTVYRFVERTYCCKSQASKAHDRALKQKAAMESPGIVVRPEHRHLPGTLYLIRYLDESGTHFKLGITRVSLAERFRKGQLISIIHLHHATLGECFDLEQSILKWAKSQGYRYSSPTTTELLRPEAYTRVLDMIKLRSVTKSYTSNGITTDTFRTASNL
jgi:hypothetical protein